MNLKRAYQIHRVAGPLALVIVALFLASTIAAELSGHPDAIRLVKRAILLALPLLVVCLAAGAATGRLLGHKFRPTPALAKKARRMPFIAANGLLVLLPSAIALDSLAQRGDFGSLFVALQGLELAAGATQLLLLALMARDGAAMARARRAQQDKAATARPERRAVVQNEVMPHGQTAHARQFPR
jgi:hypothetical protein